MKVLPRYRFKVLIDGDEKVTGDLMSDMFKPGFQPPKDIPDPADTKPEDWVDQDK